MALLQVFIIVKFKICFQIHSWLLKIQITNQVLLIEHFYLLLIFFLEKFHNLKPISDTLYFSNNKINIMISFHH